MNKDINKAVEFLKVGGVILYPTDTVWGLGCDATNAEAIQKIYELKQRDDSKSMLVLVNGDAMLNKYVKEVPELAWDIVDMAMKPTTIIYPEANNLPDNLIADDKSIGIRIVREGVSHQLISKFGKPIVSTSANISNQPTPSSYEEISNEVIDKVDYVFPSEYDQGIGRSSSIIKLGYNGEIQVIRK